MKNVRLLVEYAASMVQLRFAARQTHHPQESAANQSVNVVVSFSYINPSYLLFPIDLHGNKTEDDNEFNLSMSSKNPCHNTQSYNFHPCLFSADEIYRLCSTPFFCGNQGGLLYPFWIPGREECGHPDFKLNCNGGFAELDISSVSFRILEANYDASIIRLARSDYIGSLCPLYPFDTPFILPFASNTELLTIYSHCIVVCSTSCNSNYTSIYVGKN